MAAAKQILQSRGLATTLSEDNLVIKCKATLEMLDPEDDGLYVAAFDAVNLTAQRLASLERSEFKMNYFQVMIAARIFATMNGDTWRILLAEPGEGKTWMMLLWAFMWLHKEEEDDTRKDEVVIYCNSELTRL